VGFLINGIPGYDILESAPTSFRYRIYEYLYVEHKWLTITAWATYLFLIAFAFRAEFLDAFTKNGITGFKVRILLCVLLTLVLLLFGAHTQ